MGGGGGFNKTKNSFVNTFPLLRLVVGMEGGGAVNILGFLNKPKD